MLYTVYRNGHIVAVTTEFDAVLAAIEVGQQEDDVWFDGWERDAVGYAQNAGKDIEYTVVRSWGPFDADYYLS